MRRWPTTVEELIAAQEAVGLARPPPWRPGALMRVAGCAVCFERGSSYPGRAGERCWAAAALDDEEVVVEQAAGAPYAPGLLALREGPALEAAVAALTRRPDVLLVNATGLDHPRGAGLALHLGAMVGLPTVGVTHRTLLAEGPWPVDAAGAHTPLRLRGEVVGYWLRTRPGTRPLAVHAAWRTDPEAAVEVVLSALGGHRTPEPLRTARTAARVARGLGRRRQT